MHPGNNLELKMADERHPVYYATFLHRKYMLANLASQCSLTWAVSYNVGECLSASGTVNICINKNIVQNNLI